MHAHTDNYRTSVFFLKAHKNRFQNKCQNSTTSTATTIAKLREKGTKRKKKHCFVPVFRFNFFFTRTHKIEFLFWLVFFFGSWFFFSCSLFRCSVCFCGVFFSLLLLLLSYVGFVEFLLLRIVIRQNTKKKTFFFLLKHTQRLWIFGARPPAPPVNKFYTIRPAINVLPYALIKILSFFSVARERPTV